MKIKLYDYENFRWCDRLRYEFNNFKAGHNLEVGYDFEVENKLLRINKNERKKN